MPRCVPALLAVLVGACLALPAVAQWKWRGANNQIQYSDLPPPPGIAEKDILQRPAGAVGRVQPMTAPAPVAVASGVAPGASAPLLQPKGTDPELEAKRKAAEKEQADKAKAEEQRVAAAKAENCNRAKAHVRSMESGQRVARVNDKGEREILDDAQRAAEAKSARNVISTDCK